MPPVSEIPTGAASKTVQVIDAQVLSWVRTLHKEMFGDVWTWAGVFRKADTNIGVPWQHVEVSLQQLLGDLAFWKEHSTDLLEQAVMLHHRAVSVHPFENGNGRWSRMLANIWLRVHGQPWTEWPEKIIGSGKSVIRAKYLEAIHLADQGDYSPLVDLHRRFTPVLLVPRRTRDNPWTDTR